MTTKRKEETTEEEEEDDTTTTPTTLLLQPAPVAGTGATQVPEQVLEQVLERSRCSINLWFIYSKKESALPFVRLCDGFLFKILSTLPAACATTSAACAV